MAPKINTVHVQPGSELDGLLEKAAEGALLVDRSGKLYRLEPVNVRPSTLWANYDPERVRRVLRESAGFLKGVDTEVLLRDIHAERDQDSLGRPR